MQDFDNTGKGKASRASDFQVNVLTRPVSLDAVADRWLCETYKYKSTGMPVF